MVLNQLFAHRPSLELVNKMLPKFGIKDIKDNTTEFTLLDMAQLNTIAAIQAFENEIKEYDELISRNSPDANLLAINTAEKLLMAADDQIPIAIRHTRWRQRSTYTSGA